MGRLLKKDGSGKGQRSSQKSRIMSQSKMRKQEKKVFPNVSKESYS